MPLKSGKLTPQERIFAKRFGETGDMRYAADVAGYSSASSAHAKANDPAIQSEARQHARKRLETEGAEVGVKVLIELAMDNKQPGGVRRAAASDLIKYSGVGAGEAADAKEPHEMTAEELARAIDTLESVAAARAKPVEPGLLD